MASSPACLPCSSNTINTIADHTCKTKQHARQCLVHLPLRSPNSNLLQKQETRLRGILCVRANYNGRKGGGAGDFVAGFVLGGAVFGALGYLFAPQVSKLLSAIDREKDDLSKQLPKGLEDDEGLEIAVGPAQQKTRRNLNEKIAQLNAAIDDVSAQLRADDGLATSSATVAELESAA